MRFLADAFDADAGRFRGLRAADGAWLDAPGSEDTNGRALLALGTMIADCPDASLRETARSLFERALPTAGQLSGLRARAALLLACDAAERGGSLGATSQAYQEVGNGLRQSFEVRDVTFDWPWPELALTGENGLPAHALIVGGARLGYPRMQRMGVRAVEWLLTVQTTESGQLSLIGDEGGWPRGGTRASFGAAARWTRPACCWLPTRRGAPRPRPGSGWAWRPRTPGSWVPTMRVPRWPTRSVVPVTMVSRQPACCRVRGREATLMWLQAVEVMRAHRAPAGGVPPATRDLVSASP